MRLILLALFLLSCSTAKPKEPAELPAGFSELQAKRDLYLSLNTGWLPGCDSLLFTSLTAVGGLDVQISEAKDEQGRWFRTPEKDCYARGKSKSSISKDMLLGLAWYLYWIGDTDELEGVLIYGRAHNYVMGEGVLSRTFMTPSLQAVYAEALVKLGGKAYQPELSYPQLYDFSTKGYTAHLQLLNILLRLKTVGAASEGAKEWVSTHRASNPNNGLSCYAYHVLYTGDLADCISILLREDFFPADRLPTSSDRCQPWLWERDEYKWAPCDEGKTHSGGELIFLTKLIEDFYSQ